MSAETTPFPDNWTYIRAELAWLDRLLMRAIARQKQTNQTSDRVARNPTDKATSHWWRGFIDLDPSRGGSQVKPDLSQQPPTHILGRYGDRLAMNLQQQIPLGLPNLCQRCNLGNFERDLILLCLAPEISRRYERLYAILNNDEENCRQPSVDLGLRLFCRTDAEWRIARKTLLTGAPLLKRKIIEIYSGNSSARSLLSQKMMLQPKFVNYILSDRMAIDQVIPKARSRAKVPVMSV